MPDFDQRLQLETTETMRPVADLDERRRLAARVVVGAYYTDGVGLYETESIGATGCVVFRDCVTGWDRCLSIEDFRGQFWLVKSAAVQAA